MISEKQLAANRANAQRSTGPNTPQGKARARYNGVRHGLTGRVIVLPTEDLAAYRKFFEELVESFHPETPFERQLAQTIADTQWRLNRARSIEDGMFCAGSFGPAGDVVVECPPAAGPQRPLQWHWPCPREAEEAENTNGQGHPEIHAMLAASRVFQQDSKSFLNLTLYEQRLHRSQKQALQQLQELQEQRKAAERAAIEQAKLLHKQHKMQGMSYDPAQDGFAFSNAQVEAECLRDRRFEEAEIARRVDYNLKNYEVRIARMAA